MDKEQILALSRKENKNMDEREKLVYDKATMSGFACMTVVFLVLLVVEVLMQGNSGYDLLALYSSALMGVNFYQYKHLKKRTYLFGSCCWTLCTVIWVILTFWKG